MRMTGQADTVVRSQKAAAAKTAGEFAYVVPLIAAALVFVSPWVAVALGALTGWLAAKRRISVTEIKKPEPIPEMYKAIKPEEPGINPNIYLGHGIDFKTYKDGLESIRRRQGRLTQADIEKEAERILDDMQPTFLQDEFSTRHYFVGGSTGIGKSELFLAWAEAQIRRGGGLCLFDAKGDEIMFARIYSIIRDCGREHDLKYINLDRPNLSHTYNPLIYGNVRQIVSTAMKLYGKIEKGSAEFFGRLTRVGILAAIVALKAQPDSPRFAFTDLAAMFSEPAEFFRLYDNIPDSNTEAKNFVYMFLQNWIYVDREDGQHRINHTEFKKFMLGLQSMLMDFCHTEYLQIINDYNPDIELKSDILNGKIIIITIPTLSDKAGVEVFSRLFLADLARAIGQIANERVRPIIPYFVFLDEYGSMKDESHTDLWQLARSSNISLVMSVQGRGFLDIESTAFTNNLLTNMWNHIYLDVRDPDTRETAARIAGTTLFKLANDTVGDSFGFSHQNYQSGLLNQESHGKSISHGARETREDLIQPEDFTMGPGEAILVGKAGVLRLKLPILEFSEQLPELDEIELPRYEKHDVGGLDLFDKMAKRHGWKLSQALMNSEGVH